MYAELHAARAFSFLEAACLPEGAAALDDIVNGVRSCNPTSGLGR
jgi:hypothetical protein